MPNDPRLQTIVASSSTEVTVESEPAGADVYLERYRGDGSRARAGTTPLTIALPTTDYVVTFETQGFATASRSLPLSPMVSMGLAVQPPQATVPARLVEAGKSLPGMVYVEDEMYRLTGWSGHRAEKHRGTPRIDGQRKPLVARRPP